MEPINPNSKLDDEFASDGFRDFENLEAFNF